MTREEYEKDFDNGYEYSLKNFDPQTGKMTFPEKFGNGFAEGTITGRSKVIHDTFGEFKSINWDGGKPNITR